MHTADAEGWRPEPGDLLVGTVVDLDIGWSDFRGEYPILTIAPDKSQSKGKAADLDAVKIHCFHDVLFSRVLTLRPAPGETVGIQFHGKQPHKSKPNQTVSRYTFKVAGRTADTGGLYDRLGTGRTQRPAQPAAQSTGGFTPAAQESLPSKSDDDDDIPF